MVMDQYRSLKDLRLASTRKQLWRPPLSPSVSKLVRVQSELGFENTGLACLESSCGCRHCWSQIILYHSRL